jgi:hypothetical protein
MFLRSKMRRKDGKTHRYFSVVENRRVRSGRVVQRQVLFLGEINDSQQAAWRQTLEVFDEAEQRAATLSLFPEDREIPADALDGVQVKLAEMELRRPRAFGNYWLGCELWRQLGLESFWQARLGPGREEVPWAQVLELLVVSRLVSPGSEFRLHRQGFDQSAMGDLLGTDFAVAEKDRLYRCLDRILPHKAALFAHLRERWQELFQARFDILLYDLTSTYIEGEGEQIPKAQHGYSRDHRGDCRQVVIARRVWLMDRGIPTEEVLTEMRAPEREVFYLVGTPRGKIQQYEKKWLELPWQKVRDSVEVKLFAAEGELYVLAKSAGRRAKEQAIRRRKLVRLLWKLRDLRRKSPGRDQLLLRIGAAKKEAGRAFAFVRILLPKEGEAVTRQTFTFAVDKEKLKKSELRDGHYLLRSNLTGEDAAVLWELYLQLTQIEAAFKTLKSELGLRPIYHQLENRVEAHILVAFLAYALSVTLRQRLQALAPGLTPRAVLEKLATIQMLDVCLPTTDGRWLIMPRYTQPEPDQALMLHQLNLSLPSQPPPRIKAQEDPAQTVQPTLKM